MAHERLDRPDVDPLRASVVPNEWRRLYILIGFRPASSAATLKASRIGRSETGESRVVPPEDVLALVAFACTLDGGQRV